MHRIWAWLLAKPKPQQPAPRIVTIGVAVFVIGIYTMSFALPARTAIHVMNIVLAVCFSGAFLVVGYLTVGRPLLRRRRTR
jgi:hypothetical protein